MEKQKIQIHWFRRDLRLDDNTALNSCVSSEFPILPIFIFDEQILNELDTNDHRINFIYKTLNKIDHELKEFGS